MRKDKEKEKDKGNDKDKDKDKDKEKDKDNVVNVTHFKWGKTSYKDCEKMGKVID